MRDSLQGSPPASSSLAAAARPRSCSTAISRMAWAGHRAFVPSLFFNSLAKLRSYANPLGHSDALGGTEAQEMTWIRGCQAAFLLAVPWAVLLSACGAARQEPVSLPPIAETAPPVPAPFAISLVPTVPVPIRVGTHLGFRLSTGTAGYASLYLIDPAGQVVVLTENLPVSAGSLDYPSPAEGFTLTASEPIGFNRAILLVTREPFDGFSGAATLTRPVGLASRGDEFLAQLDRATRALSRASWATDEIQIRVVG